MYKDTHGKITRKKPTQAKLAPGEVKRIRRIYKDGKQDMKELAEKYSVTMTQVWRIIHRVSWKHL